MRYFRFPLAVIFAALVLASPAQAAFGLQSGPAGFSVNIREANGEPARLAGSHPFALDFDLAFEAAPSGFPEGDLRDLYLRLPPGLIENPTAVPRCSQADFSTPRSSPYEASRSGEDCPRATQIGTVAIDSAAGTRHFGVFNLAPPPGYPSRFGFAPYGAPITFSPTIRQADGGYGITLASRNFTQLFDTRSIALTIWGNPWATEHAGQRGNCLNELEPAVPHAQCPIAISEQTHTPRAYLTLPGTCSEPLSFSVSADSWTGPGGYGAEGEPSPGDPAWQTAQFQLPENLQGCGQLSFFSQGSVQPTAGSVSSPTGLLVRFETNQSGLLAPSGRLAPQVKEAIIELPEGMTINPSVGAGLGACTEAQFAAESPSSTPGQGCPNPSKIGTVSLETPLVEGGLAGSLFIATPYANPFGSPYALYFVAKSSQSGFIVKVAGRLDADPRTGRLTATFDDLPQLPYSDLRVNFREGQRAPLVTPAACGIYRSELTLRSWVQPAPDVKQGSLFSLIRGITAGGSCPLGGARFAPGAVAGTLNSNAGSATSFYLHMTRTDAEQEITSYSAQLPPGLLGKIAAVPLCPDAAIEAAKSRSGVAEDSGPSCPEASRIGRTFSGYGVGLAPAYSPGRIYLAGPYHGAPLSVVAINPALVGPFDLGTIVIRSAIQVDPRSAQVTIDSSGSDPIPHIFAGIPLRLRDIRIHIDRPDFMRNPTSCAPFSIVSTLTGSDAPFADPRAASAAATVPYQLANCSSLKFSPAFALSLIGPTRRGGYPRLKATVAPRAGDANISSAVVTLPPSLFLAQNHIKDICTRPQFAADACPGGSVVGAVRAQTPLLSEPLEGSVYLRSSDNPLPDLVAVMRARGVRIVLEGRIDSHDGGIRARFEGLPDAPVSQFTMTIFGGRKRGILVNSDQLCRKPRLAVARFVSQSNAVSSFKPRFALRCAKGKGGKSKRGRG